MVGRTSDFIIRGGKNISAAGGRGRGRHPPRRRHGGGGRVPDPVFGERVCAVRRARPRRELEPRRPRRAPAGALGLAEWFPERLVVVDDLPRSSGGKVAKGELRADLQTFADN